MDKIIIKGLEIFAYHGVNPEEKEKGQIFIIDAVLEADLTVPCHSDNLDDTINYSKAVKAITAAMTAEKYDLIEKAAEMAAESVLLLSDKIESVDITLKKPHAPIKADFDYVAVEIKRSRLSNE